MKIVIIGGGSAGWLAASMFLKNNGPNVDIVVVESSKIGIIGAGEGSTGSLPMYINEMWTDSSINEISFLKKTKATLKLAINLKNWRGDGESYFSTILPSPTANALQDDAFLTSIVKNGTGDSASMNTLLLKDGLTTYNKKFRHGIPHNFPHAYHFDGHELGKFFKENNESIKKLVKEKLASEDDQKRAEADIQRFTDKHIADIDKVIASKEQEIMAV